MVYQAMAIFCQTVKFSLIIMMHRFILSLATRVLPNSVLPF